MKSFKQSMVYGAARAVGVGAFLLCFLLAGPAIAAQEGARPASTQGQHDDLGAVGAKLSNPISNVWALFTEFDLTFNDGDLNTGDAEVSGAMVFQPILPVPLYGSDADQYKLILRPTIPAVFGQPIPQGVNDFDRKTSLGDTLFPMVVALPPAKTGRWLVAVGPTFLFPTSTRDALGDRQWGLGPAAVLGYKTEKSVIGVFPQYHFHIGDRGDQDETPDLSKMTLLYFGFIDLPDAWQIGFNPSITYNDKASSDNKWNVPVGLAVTKTLKIAGRPVKFQAGVEYSVVSEDAFGKEMLFKLNVIPVISSLIENPIFGG